MRTKILGLLATITVLASGLVLLVGGSAEAQKVANTGPGQLIFDSGTLAIRDQTFDAGSSEDQVVADINVAANGSYTVTGLTFPPIPPLEGPFGNVNVNIQLLSGSGTVNPYNGAGTLNLSLQINISGGGVGSGCRIGPINIAASTATLGGVPYNPANGRITLADRTFSVPESQSCGLAAGLINDELGLPSPSGQNSAVFGGFFDPIRAPAVVPSFTTTPSSGFAPLNVAFNASGSTSVRPVSSYQWDFTNNGSFDATGQTTSFTYLAPGTYTARLRVTDVDGDAAETTRTVVVNTPFPDVTVDKSGPAGIVHGDTGSFTIVVGSEGQLPAAGATVVDTLPAGLAYAGSSGAGWSCGAVGQQVTCTSADPVAPGSDFPTLTIDATADASVTGDVVNSATVSTTGEGDTSDNADTATTRLIQPGIDLTVDKVHDEDDGLFAGERATYVITIGNAGTQPAVETIEVTDVLPAGTTFVSASGGFDWVCAHSAGTVSCFSDEDLAPGDTLDDIRIRVELTAVTSPLSNTASVTVTGESNPANDTDTDTGEVQGLAVDYTVLKTHLGDIVVGEPTTYGIGVQNVGTLAGAGEVTVTDVLPAGLTYVGASGDGWACGAVGQTVTCTHPGGVEAGDLLPGISLQVVADAAAMPSVSNTATVSGPGDANAANDGSTHTGAVRQPRPDLTLLKSHQGNFTTGSNGTYTLAVSNVAAERADGPTVVTDSLPPGVTFVSAAGDGWTCDASALPQVTCTHAGVIPGLASAPPISLVVHAPDGAPEIVVNGAGVANAQDTNPVNDADFDPTRIDRRAPAPTVLEAEAIVLRLNIGFGISISLLDAPTAVLTSGGVPVPGKAVTFRTLNQSQVICTGITDANGRATCSGNLLTYLTTLTSLRYTADFTGDVDFAAAHDEAAIVHLQGIKLL